MATGSQPQPQSSLGYCGAEAERGTFGPLGPRTTLENRRTQCKASRRPWRGFVVCDVGHIGHVDRAIGAVSATENGALVGWRRGQSDAGSDILRPPDRDASPQQQLYIIICCV